MRSKLIVSTGSKCVIERQRLCSGEYADTRSPAQDICVKTHLVVEQRMVKNKGGGTRMQITVSIKSERNDRWLNSHIQPLMECHMANFDVQLTVDVGKIIGYMTKYVTKSEASMTPAAKRMAQRFLKKAMDEGRSVQSVLKQTMGKLLGERMMPKQECCSLILSIPTVKCSHTFSKVNLANDTRRVALGEADAGPGLLMTIVDAYAVRCEVDYWLSEAMLVGVQGELPRMNLNAFAANYYMGSRGAHRNKIKLNQKNKRRVIVFFPRLSPNPESPSYTDYCRYALTQHKPWLDSPDSIWGGAEATDAHIQDTWKTYLEELETSGQPVPDSLRQEIDRYLRQAVLPDHGLEGVEVDTDDLGHLGRDDWMEGAAGYVAESADTADDDVVVQWAQDHDFSVPVQSWGGEHTPIEDFSATYRTMCRNFRQRLYLRNLAITH
jgi:hypothetical protein